MKNILTKRIESLEERNETLKEELKICHKAKDKQFFEIIIEDNKTRINECEFLLKELKNINTIELIKELRNRGYIRVFWRKEDIKLVAENNFDNPIYLTDEQLNKVVTFIEHKFDPNIGVSWYTLQYSIVNVLKHYENKEDE